MLFSFLEYLSDLKVWLIAYSLSFELFLGKIIRDLKLSFIILKPDFYSFT